MYANDNEMSNSNMLRERIKIEMFARDSQIDLSYTFIMYIYPLHKYKGIKSKEGPTAAIILENMPCSSGVRDISSCNKKYKCARG